MFKELFEYFKVRGTQYLELEIEMIETVFSLLTLMSLLGYPLIPGELSLRILPYMGSELEKLYKRIERLEEQLAFIAGQFDIG